MVLREITDEELAHVLAEHKRWAETEHAEGARADLKRADLSWKNFRGADLRGAYLGGACLRGAYLGGACLRGAYLRGADLRGAYLGGADLRGADLRGADLRGAYLGGACLRGAYLGGACLRGAYLGGAYLRGAYLRGAKNAELALAMTSICPEGELLVWKQAMISGSGGKALVHLRIPADAKRSNATGRKCRAEFAEVLEVTDPDGNPVDEAYSKHDRSFRYRAGKTVRPTEPFDEDRFNECASGIHFYLTREEAMAD